MKKSKKKLHNGATNHDASIDVGSVSKAANDDVKLAGKAKSGSKKNQPAVELTPEEKLSKELGLVNLKEDEAREIIISIQSNDEEYRENIWQLRTRNAYVALGYSDWKTFCKVELSHIGSCKEIDRHVRATTVEKRLGLKTASLVPSSTRKLYALDDEALKSVWAEANKHCDEGKNPTAEQVDTAVEQHLQFAAMLQLVKTAKHGKKLEIAKVLVASWNPEKIDELRSLVKARKEELADG